MRRTYVNVNGEWVEKQRARGLSTGPEIVPDIQPYQSMVTGETITSRSKHRQHLKDYGMVEVGNDSSLSKPYRGMPDANPEQRKEILRHLVNKIPHDEWNRMGKRHREEVIRHMERYGKG